MGALGRRVARSSVSDCSNGPEAEEGGGGGGEERGGGHERYRGGALHPRLSHDSVYCVYSGHSQRAPPSSSSSHRPSTEPISP